MTLNEKECTGAGKLVVIKENAKQQKRTPKPARKKMSMNDTFSALLLSPLGSRMEENFNESFGDKTTLTPSTIFRSLQKEHEQISTILRILSPSTAQYQHSLSELITLYERSEEQQLNVGVQRLILSVFLKLSANILTVMGKLTYQPALYKLSQIIASSIEPNLEDEEDLMNLQKWADRVVFECAIHMIDFPNYELDAEINIDGIVDDLLLGSSNIQFVRSSAFVAAVRLASEMDCNVHIAYKSKLTLDNISDEHFLRLLLWLYLRNKNFLKTDLLSSLFSSLPLTLNAQEYVRSSECSLLDVNLYLVSLSVVASTTSESGLTLKSAPVIASQLSLTKHQKDCWKAIVDTCAGVSSKAVAALARLRTSQLVESVRLISDGSEDVRVLFEAWKSCLQPSATHDENVYEAIKTVTDKYIAKMNSLLAYGPFYSTDAFSRFQPSSVSRRDMKTLFPLQFDYEFVNTTEAEHIGTVINSLEGYMSPEPEEVEQDQGEALSIKEDTSFGDETFHSFGSASDQFTSANNSQFFSPLPQNKESIRPSSVSQLIRDDSAHTSHFSTKSVILTPTRSTASPTQSVSGKKITTLSFERHQTADVTPSQRDNGSDEDEEEEDELEAALLESTEKHERSILAQKTPEKAQFVQKLIPTPTKDAQTETDASITSSGEGSISSVRYTPKREIKTDKNVEPMYSSASEADEYEDEDYEEEIEYEDEEEDEETEAEDVDEGMTEEQADLMMVQILEATTMMFRDLRMKKFAIESQKIQFENTSDDDILRLAELKLAKINSDITATSERLNKLKTPSVTTIFTPRVPPPLQAANQLFENRGVDHDSKQCLGCQDIPD